MTRTRLLIVAVFALALLALPSAALAKDSDHDGMPNGWEKAHGLNPNKANAKKDPDHDGLTNIQEFRHKTDPKNADSDGDNLNDGQEVELGDNPNDPDTDNDGVKDGNEIAGTIQHFDSTTNVLTIVLADGTTTRSGAVNDQTRIKCDDNSPASVSAARHGADDGPNHDIGDDHGGKTGSTGSSSSDKHGSDDGTGGHGSGGHGGRSNCTTADLTDNRVVHEAKLVSDGNGGFVFTKVELDG
jgi:hypothetical protein